MRKLLFFLCAILALGQQGPTAVMLSLGSSAAVGCGAPTSTNLVAWHKADCFNGGSPCSALPSNGASVTSSTWKDMSGNGRDATITTGGAQFDTNQINSLPAVESTSASGMWWQYANTASSLDEHTIFVVFLNHTNPTMDGAFYMGTTGGVLYRMFSPQDFEDRAFTVLGHGASTISADTWHQSNVQESGSGSTSGFRLLFRLDRANDSITVNSPIGNVTPAFIFGYLSGSGNKVAEAFYYNAYLSSTDITANEAYLNCKYGL